MYNKACFSEYHGVFLNLFDILVFLLMSTSITHKTNFLNTSECWYVMSDTRIERIL